MESSSWELKKTETETHTHAHCERSVSDCVKKIETVCDWGKGGTDRQRKNMRKSE